MYINKIDQDGFPKTESIKNSKFSNNIIISTYIIVILYVLQLTKHF